MWYVVQVMGGQEKTTLDLIQCLKGEGALEDAFIPQREVMRHVGGEWVTVRETLFPGYLFVVTGNPSLLHEQLMGISAFTRLLGCDNSFVPLTSEEEKFVSAFQDEGHVVRMSEGVIEGDEIRILKGPLRDYDATIVKIDRHKRAAYVRMRMFGRDTTVKLGLEIVRKTA